MLGSVNGETITRKTEALASRAMSSLATEKAIYDDLSELLRAASRDRAEATVAPLPEVHLRVAGSHSNQTEPEEQSQEVANSEKKKTTERYHYRFKSSHAIGDHRVYGTGHFPISTGPEDVRQAMRQDLLEEDEQGELGEDRDPSSGIDGMTSTQNMDYIIGNAAACHGDAKGHGSRKAFARGSQRTRVSVSCANAIVRRFGSGEKTERVLENSCEPIG